MLHVVNFNSQTR